MSKKYEFTGEEMKLNGVTLHRIRRISDGEIGGWIESEDNLSHEGAAWVSGEACISGNARVYGDAWVSGNARVSGNAQVYGDARVYDNARVSFSTLTIDYASDHAAALRVSLNVGVINGVARLYKYVRRINDRTFASVHDPYFLYRIGKTVEVEADPDPSVSCGSGLHASTLDYWEGNDDANACIAVDIRVEDIICVLDGKVRCKRLTVVGEVENSIHAIAVKEGSGE